MKQRFSNMSKYLNDREYIEEYDTSMIDYVPQYSVIKNGYILPTSIDLKTMGGVVDNERNFVEYSGNKCASSFINISKAYEFTDFDTQYENENVIFLGYYMLHWGHMLWDCVGKFWILNKPEYADYKVCFLPYMNEELKGNFLRFVELSGVDKSRMIMIDKPSRFKTIVVPESTHDSDRWLHSAAYKEIFDTVVRNSDYQKIEVPSKVYFSRESFGKPEWGENEISRNFERNGYTVVYPEKMTLDEQIAIMQKADKVASQNSSICLNCVFAREGLEWIVINKYSAVHENFSECRFMSKIEPIFIDAYSPCLNFYGETVGTRPYLVSFNQNMKKYFDDNNMIYTLSPIKQRYKQIISYLWACLTTYFKFLFWPLVVRMVKGIKKCDFIYKILKKIEKVLLRK